MYRSASSFSSTWPSTRTPAWFGYHAQHDDLIVVPPSVDIFSTRSTSAPSRSALSAAEKPAAPEPTTTTSTSCAIRSSSVNRRSGPLSVHVIAAGSSHPFDAEQLVIIVIDFRAETTLRRPRLSRFGNHDD